VSPDVSPNFKPEKPARNETTNQRRGRLNKQKGHRKQSLARKALEDLFETGVIFHGRKANEEAWNFPVRPEVKAGQQVEPISRRYLAAEANPVDGPLSGPFLRVERATKDVKPFETKFNAAEKQSARAKPTGDPRPFVFIAMPDGMTDGLFVCRLSVVKELLGGDE